VISSVLCNHSFSVDNPSVGDLWYSCSLYHDHEDYGIPCVAIMTYDKKLVVKDEGPIVQEILFQKQMTIFEYLTQKGLI
jgi:hypothetical protein